VVIASGKLDALQDTAWHRGSGRNLRRHRRPGAATAHGVCLAQTIQGRLSSAVVVVRVECHITQQVGSVA
jgi:hypothetical protein